MSDAPQEPILQILPSSVRPPAKRVSALGIDLGTTNSTVAEAYWQPGAAAPVVRCIPVEQELPGGGPQPGVLVPSFVALDDGETWVGEGARRLRAAKPDLPRNDGRVLRLASPVLGLEAFEKLLVPFLDEDVLVAKDDDYRLTCSIFAPIQDALARARVGRDDVSACLLVGGSTLIPQVVDAVKAHFPKSRVLCESDPELAQTAVARGAACHALSLALCGEGLVRPVAGDSILLRTVGGTRELLARGEALPFPESGWSELRLVVPEAGATEPVPLRVEVLSGTGDVVVSAEWPITPPVKKNEPLLLKYRLDENQALHLQLSLAHHPDRGVFRCQKINPLTNVVNPQPVRLELAQAEERLRAGERSAPLVERAAELCTELGHFGKALDLLRARLSMDGRPNAGILNRIGILVDRMRESPRAARLYRAAAEASPGWSIPLFNLALLHRTEGRWAEAREVIDRALRLERGIPHLVLSAQIAEGAGTTERRDEHLAEALRTAGPLGALDDWDLLWLLTGARMKGDQAVHRAAEAERKRTHERPDTSAQTAAGVLPAESPVLVRAS